MSNKGNKAIGVAVIGCGTIGALRAFCSSENSGVGYLGVCDLIESKARAVADKCKADEWSTDYKKIIDNPEVDAVFISTGEADHFDSAVYAAQKGKAILIEKPLVLKLDEGAELLRIAKDNNVKIFTGFTQRFRRRFLTAKEQLLSGFLQSVDSAFGKIYVTQAVAESVLSRSPFTTPSINTLTYQVDLMLWYMEGKKPVSVYAKSVSNIFKKYNNAPDATWAILNFDDGTFCTLGVSWQPPKQYPAYVCTMELELFGPNGMLSIDDSHRDYILASAKPIPAAYTPDVLMNVAFLGSAMPGDWALEKYWGPMKSETDAFIESVVTGIDHPALPTGEQGYRVLEITLAIDKSAREGKEIKLPLADNL
ncbi:MAG: Gfo/Idh/MocA family oxidoreductase [Syntrophomonadaceae bacterium]|nr:Gfo/Idh/MocA family oxidoreductase [Syntrophomonadaceae bacterium]